MPQQDTSQIKEKIISTIRVRGPSLPVHISKAVNTSPLFASAFLSELIAEKRLKTSNMKVGNSPLYLIPGQEHHLAKFYQHLRSKEKEAYLVLKEKRILKNSELDPAIRVAMKDIKDFAIPIKKDDDLYWKYLTVSEEEESKQKFSVETDAHEDTLRIKEKAMPLIKDIKEQFEEKEEEIQKEEQVSKKELNIFDEKEAKEKEKTIEATKIKEEKPKKKVMKKISKKKNNSSKNNDKFFNKVKEYLQSKSIGISDIVGFSKTDLTLKIKNEAGEEKLLVAYNKKTIKEDEIIKAHKKAQELELKYMILSLGNPLKKTSNLIEAIRNLSEIDKIE